MSRPSVVRRPSPNHGPRAPGKPIDILLLHYTGMQSDEGAAAWLCDPRSEVSSHYLVEASGRIVQLVDEDRRAWHAGRSFWAGETDINSRSIGIEIGNPGHAFGYRPFPEVQIRAVVGLCRDVLSRHSIPPERVLAHSDVAPERKQDPGEFFPWRALFEAGIGHWLPSFPLDWPGEGVESGSSRKKIRDLQAELAAYGYNCALSGAYDEQTRLVVTAFQRHFRPESVTGRADASTLATLSALAAALARS